MLRPVIIFGKQNSPHDHQNNPRSVFQDIVNRLAEEYEKKRVDRKQVAVKMIGPERKKDTECENDQIKGCEIDMEPFPWSDRNAADHERGKNPFIVRIKKEA